jgi:hypothetical protein
MVADVKATGAAVAAKPTQEEVSEGLRLLAKKRERDAKIKAGLIKGHTAKSYKDMTPEEKAKRQAYSKRKQIKDALIAKKALAAGIKVTEAEIDAAMKA